MRILIVFGLMTFISCSTQTAKRFVPKVINGAFTHIGNIKDHKELGAIYGDEKAPLLVINNQVYLTPDRCLCNRKTGGDKDGRNAGGDKEGRNSGGDKEGRNFGGDKDSRSMGGDKDGRNAGGDKEGRNSGGDKESRNTAGEILSISCQLKKPCNLKLVNVRENMTMFFFDEFGVRKIEGVEILLR